MKTYVLRESAGPDLIETLGLEYSKSLPEKEEIIQYYDTFDWRLYQKGLALIQAGNAVYLQRISDGAYPHDQIEMKQHLEGRFWWMFPEGELRDTLRSALSVRALLLRAQVRQRVLRIWHFKMQMKRQSFGCFSRIPARKTDALRL